MSEQINPNTATTGELSLDGPNSPDGIVHPGDQELVQALREQKEKKRISRIVRSIIRAYLYTDNSIDSDIYLDKEGYKYNTADLFSEGLQLMESEAAQNAKVEGILNNDLALAFHEVIKQSLEPARTVVITMFPEMDGQCLDIFMEHLSDVSLDTLLLPESTESLHRQIVRATKRSLRSLLLIQDRTAEERQALAGKQIILGDGSLAPATGIDEELELLDSILLNPTIPVTFYMSLNATEMQDIVNFNIAYVLKDFMENVHQNSHSNSREHWLLRQLPEVIKRVKQQFDEENLWLKEPALLRKGISRSEWIDEQLDHSNDQILADQIFKAMQAFFYIQEEDTAIPGPGTSQFIKQLHKWFGEIAVNQLTNTLQEQERLGVKIENSL